MHDFSDRADLRLLGDLVGAILDCSPGMALMQVGAGARDLLMVQMHGIQPRRRTNDSDFAFAIADWAAYGQLRRVLTASGRFIPDPNVPHRLRDPSGVLPVDFVPYDGVEDAQAQIGWPPDGSPVMSVLGYREAAASAHDVLLPGKHPLKVPSLPMQVLLKLFAWDDRHLRVPRKDAADLVFLLDHGLDVLGHERLFEAAPALFDDPAFDHRLAAG